MSQGAIKNDILNAASIIAGIVLCVLIESWPALIVTGLLLLIHKRISLPGEWRLIIQVTVIGWLFDAILLRSDVIGGLMQPAVWQLCIWALLASGLCHALKGLQSRFALSVPAGIVIGCALYLLLIATTRLTITWPWAYWLALIGLCWALLMPLLVFISKRVVQMPDTPPV